MEYIKDENGLVKTILVRDNEENDLETLENLSLKADAKVYLLPEGAQVTLNNEGWLVSATGNTKDIFQIFKGWSMPYECFINGFPFPIKTEKMWNSQKDIETISIQELIWNLKAPWWGTEEVGYKFIPEEVLKDLDSYKDHKDRIENSDIKYPLLLVETKQNRWLIYDGLHRFAKQILEGKEVVSCQKFSIEDMKEYILDTHKELFNEWMKVEYDSSM